MKIIDFIDLDSLREADLVFTYSITDSVTKFIISRGVVNVSLVDGEVVFDEGPVIIRGVKQIETFNSDIKMNVIRDGTYIKFVVEGLDVKDVDINCKKQYFPL